MNTMQTLAVICVIGWAAAATFGWIALAAPAGAAASHLVLNIILAALGAAIGLTSWLRLRRAA
ncbi:hypothetical protein ACEYYB_07460 [Paracoccus sp. p4-l81]|uniref:hypothetical protein n=1 Tax=unclassified Paracoccus (in: a-proteobacteria) TaxID=2688777 RepID=UPI0035B82E9C